MSDASRAASFLGSSLYTSLGSGVAENLQALSQVPRDPQILVNQSTEEALHIPYNLLGEMPLANPQEQLYALIAQVADEAMQEANMSASERRNAGLFLGSSSFDLNVWEARFANDLAQSPGAIALSDGSISILADYLVTQMGIRGEDYSFNTACTASANALSAAVAQVEAGFIDHALVIGVELFNEVTALGFHGLGLLSDSVMRSFDEDCKGLVLGEGISALVVGRAEGNARGGFRLRGAANYSDSHSITAVTPDGSTIATVMEWALRDAGLTATDIHGVKVHGTASRANDEAEAAGMHRVFSTMPPLVALKPYLGHTLGACGLNELVLFYRAIEAGFLPATPGISGGVGGLCLNQTPSSLDGGNFMLNYFGFGGNNASLIISNVEGEP